MDETSEFELMIEKIPPVECTHDIHHKNRILLLLLPLLLLLLSRLKHAITQAEQLNKKV